MNNTKKCVWFFSIIIFLSLILYVYRNKTEKKEFIKKDNRIAVFINDKEVTNGIPSKSSGYVFDKYVCSNNDTLIEWDNSSWSFSTNNVGSSVTCSLYFKYDPKPYLVDTVSVGQFVAYIPPAGKSSASRTCFYSYANQYSGWRILSKNGFGIAGIVTLIHAGTPECYKDNYNESSQQIININALARAYVNDELANSGRSVNCNDVKSFDGDACTWNYHSIETDLIKTGSFYWLTTASNTNVIWFVAESGCPRDSSCNTYNFGVRPVIVLKSGIKNTGGLGTNESPFTISN